MNFFFIIALLLVAGGILFPLITYIRESKKESNKVTKLQNDTSLTEQFKDKIEKNKNVGATQDILDFDNVIPCNDNAALLQVGKHEFLGYLEIQGVPFNLLSDDERLSLEESYGDLLNGIDFPFQNYVQSRILPLDNYLNRYSKKVEELKKKVSMAEEKFNSTDENSEEKTELEDKLNKLKTQLEYGFNLLDDFKNKNIDCKLLKRNYYVIIKHTYEKVEDEELSEFEILEHAFSDIANRSNLFSDTLERNGLNCTFSNANQMMDLLYNSYNKSDASSLKLDNAVKAKYNHISSTSKPIFEKKIENEIAKTEEKQRQIEKNIKKEYKDLKVALEKEEGKVLNLDKEETITK